MAFTRIRSQIQWHFIQLRKESHTELAEHISYYNISNKLLGNGTDFFLQLIWLLFSCFTISGIRFVKWPPRKPLDDNQVIDDDI